jgi:hypothetical protein
MLNGSSVSADDVRSVVGFINLQEVEQNRE